MEAEPSNTGVPDALREVLWRTHDVQAALARRMGVGINDVLALQTLAEQITGTVGLSAALGIRSASATVLADRLETAGHLRRTAHPTDGRRVVLTLTDSARAEVGGALAPLLDNVDRIVTALDPERREAVESFLRQVAAAMTRFAQDEPGVPERADAHRAREAQQPPREPAPSDPGHITRHRP